MPNATFGFGRLRRPDLGSIAALVFAILLCAGRASATAVFTDNFSRTTGLGSNWSVLYGSYSTDGTYAISGTPPVNGNWASVAQSLGTDDYSVTALIRIPFGSVDSGLFVRSSDSVNFDRTMYALELNTDGTVILYRRTDWNWTQLDSVNAGISANTNYTTKFVAMGTNPVHLEGWINGTQVVGYDDTSSQQIGTGVVGMLNYASGVKYTNFEVDSVPSHLFFDYFNQTSGLSSNWSIAYGSFTTDGGQAISGSPPINGNWASVVPPFGTNDYWVSADVTIPSGSFYSGVVARSDVSGYFDSDLYAALLSTDGTVSLFRRNSWNWTQLSSAPAGIASGIQYSLQLRATGSDPVALEVWLNGSKQFSYSDNDANQIRSGLAGIMNYASGVDYTAFMVDAATLNSNVLVSVEPAGNGYGTVTSSPAGINCPGTCSMFVTQGTTVSFFPVPNAGNTFAGWAGACRGVGSCSVVANDTEVVFAAFEPQTVQIHVTTYGMGTVTSTPSGISCPSNCVMTVNYNASVSLSAAAGSGFTFAGWRGDCSGTGTCTVPTTRNSDVIADFTSSPSTWTVSVVVSGSGTVNSTPSGISCSSGTCSHSFADGTSVSLSETPGTGYSFGGWGGACSGSGGCSFVLHSNLTVSGAFAATGNYPCGTTPCAIGQFPPATWRPYGPNSAFNKPVPVNPARFSDPTTNSTNIVNTILNTWVGNAQTDNFWYPPDGSSGWPTYYSTSGTGNELDTLKCTLYGQTCSADASHLGSFYAPDLLPET